MNTAMDKMNNAIIIIIRFYGFGGSLSDFFEPVDGLKEEPKADDEGHEE